MRPTPETDAAELSAADYAVTLDEARGVIRRLARRVSALERERDEALAALRFSLGMSCLCPICNRTSAEQVPNKEANK